MRKLVTQSEGDINEAARESVGLDLYGLGEGPVAKSGGQGKEPLVSIKDEETLD